MIGAYNSDDQRIDLPCEKILKDEHIDGIKDNLALDIINIFAAIYIQDISVLRGKSIRRLNVSVPVSTENYNLWKDNLQSILNLVNYVTEGDNDCWNICFQPVTYSFPNRLKIIAENIFSSVSLLSGGLDSFCGISKNEQEGEISIYCSYKTSLTDTSYIYKVQDFARKRIPNSRFTTYEGVGYNKKTPTQRTRSLLFFSLACLGASAYGANVIKVYENGIMSLNPSFESRGTTKTTHPKTIMMFQNLLEHIGFQITFDCPFMFSTKGEMLSSLSKDYQQQIKNTRSCSKSKQDKRYNKKGVSGCGVCVPCLLRKISLSAYDMELYDHEYCVPYEGKFDDDEYVSSYGYYKKFLDLIESESIFPSLDMRKAYYSEGDYWELTELMLRKFSLELQIFFKKYGR